MRVCPSCGEENSDRARFCQSCAAPLLSPQIPVEERKVVSVLFCDLVGFTAASENADPEDVQARLSVYHRRIRSEIERYAGTVEKFIGDAVMAVFGAPVVHEDDPERAVRAGLRILEAISELNEADPELRLQVRVGIETGEALVSLAARPDTGEGMVSGDVVNTAARLQGAAPVNDVVVGTGTFAATTDVFDYDSLAPVRVKGKSTPLSRYRVRAALSRLGKDITRRHSTALVGRRRERRLLKETFERCVRDRSVQLVTVIGDPGVGKSRMVSELFSSVRVAAGDTRWRVGRCLPFGDGGTFWALGEIVKAEAGILETDAPETAILKIEAVVPKGHPDAQWLCQRLRPLIGVDAPTASRDENFAAWRAFLESLATDRPAVLVFEDLHWGDDALLTFVEEVADRARRVPMLLLTTARPELFERVPSWGATQHVTKIHLSPLDRAETSRLIANLLQEAVLPADVEHPIVERSGGNPLYAEEFVRLLKDRGLLSKANGLWNLKGEANLPLPSGVQAIIAARLDTLSSAGKQLIQDAAVLGSVFWAGAVAEMGDRTQHEAGAALRELSVRELIHRSETASFQGQAEYVFSHALVRDVAYAEIPRRSRVERHRRAALWIERVAGERVEDQAEILAVHYSTALELARPTRHPDIEELRAKSVQYLTLAGDRAMSIDVVAAERHYARALDVAAPGDPRRPAMLARHAESLRQRGQLVDAAERFEQAIEGFRMQHDIRGMAVAMDGWGLVLRWMGDARHWRVSIDALNLLEPLGPTPELVNALTEEAGSRFIASDYEPAIALADRAILLAAEVGMPEPARALGFRGASRAFLGDVDGVTDMHRALKSAISQGLGREVAVLQANLAIITGLTEGPRPLLAKAREVAAFADRRGIKEFALALTSETVTELVELGSYDEALATVAEIIPRLEEAEDVLDLVLARSTVVCILTRRGTPVEATPLAEWVVVHAREMADPEVVALGLVDAAGLRLALGDRSGAAALLAEVESTPRIRSARYFVQRLADAVRTALAAGVPDLAAELPEGVVPTYPLHQAALVTVGAILKEHQGGQGEAERLHAQSAELWRQFEMPWERAHALLGKGRCLATLGRPSDAEASCGEARQLFAELGAKPMIDEIDELLSWAATRS